jgi:uncharacterized iron-regulated membrane protein
MTQTLPEEPELPPSLRLLKRLVTVLTLVMILAVITITGLFVTRLPNLAAPPALPEALALPEGTTARAVTMGTGWIAVVTGDDRILIFGTDGTLRQEIRIDMNSP